MTMLYRHTPKWEIQWWQRLLLLFYSVRTTFDYELGILTVYKVMNHRVYILQQQVLDLPNKEDPHVKKRRYSGKAVRLKPDTHGTDKARGGGDKDLRGDDGESVLDAALYLRGSGRPSR